MLHLCRRLLPLLRAASHPTTTAAPSSSLHLRASLLSTSASAYASPTPFSIEDYLLTTCGLTRAQALNASKKLSRLNSASNPDAVLALLSGVGLSRPDIAAVVAADPLLLRARVDNIARRLASLRDRVGLSHPQIARFLMVGGARTLRSCDVAPRLEFWIPFFGSFDKLLKKVKWNNSLLLTDLERVAKPNIALLGACGLRVCDIVKLTSRLLVFKPERVKVLVKRAEKLGVPRTSRGFKYAVSIVAHVNEEKVAARMEFLRSTLACSKDKLRIAVCRMPQILGLSEEKLRCKIEFMVTAGEGISEERCLCRSPFWESACRSPTLTPCDGDIGGSFRLIANTTPHALMLISQMSIHALAYRSTCVLLDDLSEESHFGVVSSS